MQLDNEFLEDYFLNEEVTLLDRLSAIEKALGIKAGEAETEDVFGTPGKPEAPTDDFGLDLPVDAAPALEADPTDLTPPETVEPPTAGLDSELGAAASDGENQPMDVIAGDGSDFGTPPDQLDVNPEADQPRDAQPEVDDISNISYQEKVNLMIKFVKELGYGNVDYKIMDDHNILVVTGEIKPLYQNLIRDIMRDLNLMGTIASESINDDQSITRISLENVVDIQAFKRIYNIGGRSVSTFGTAVAGAEGSTGSPGPSLGAPEAPAPVGGPEVV